MGYYMCLLGIYIYTYNGEQWWYSQHMGDPSSSQMGLTIRNIWDHQLDTNMILSLDHDITMSIWFLNLGYHLLYPLSSLSELCGSGCQKLLVAPPKKCPPCAPPLWLVLQLICYQWCIRLQSGSCQSLVCVHKFIKNYPDNTTSGETQWITQKHANPHGNHRTTSPTWLDKICCKWGWGDIMYHDAGEYVQGCVCQKTLTLSKCPFEVSHIHPLRPVNPLHPLHPLHPLRHTYYIHYIILYQLHHINPLHTSN